MPWIAAVITPRIYVDMQVCGCGYELANHSRCCGLLGTLSQATEVGAGSKKLRFSIVNNAEKEKVLV